MSENLTDQEINRLKSELSEAKKQLEDIRNNPTAVQLNPQDKFLEALFDKGENIFLEYRKMKKEADQLDSQITVELEKEEMKIIERLDKREKIYKGTLIGVCIISLLISAVFIQKAEVVIPVLSLIIGLLFKSNSLSDFLSHAKRKLKSGGNEG